MLVHVTVFSALSCVRKRNWHADEANGFSRKSICPSQPNSSKAIAHLLFDERMPLTLG
jgi:hypothetical protein